METTSTAKVWDYVIKYPPINDDDITDKVAKIITDARFKDVMLKNSTQVGNVTVLKDTMPPALGTDDDIYVRRNPFNSIQEDPYYTLGADYMKNQQVKQLHIFGSAEYSLPTTFCSDIVDFYRLYRPKSQRIAGLVSHYHGDHNKQCREICCLEFETIIQHVDKKLMHEFNHRDNLLKFLTHAGAQKVDNMQYTVYVCTQMTNSITENYQYVVNFNWEIEPMFRVLSKTKVPKKRTIEPHYVVRGHILLESQMLPETLDTEGNIRAEGCSCWCALLAASQVKIPIIYDNAMTYQNKSKIYFCVNGIKPVEHMGKGGSYSCKS